MDEDTPETTTEKERIYDEQISPLVASIIEICKANKINMAAIFGLGESPEDGLPFFCSTAIPVDEDSADYERVCEVSTTIQHGRRPSSFMAVTIGEAAPP